MDIYTTRALVEVIRVQPSPTTYWLDNFFPRQMNFTEEEIQFDLVTGGRPLAPFVAPNVGGRIMKERGYTARTFRPAYLKPKSAITPDRAFVRRPGEAIGGALTPEARWNAAIAEAMRLHKDAITRRWDWMACKAIADGAVTVEGEDYPSVTVDFGRDSSLDSTLTGAARWSQGTATPLDDLRTMRQAAFDVGRAPITRLTFGLDAWAWFVSFDEVKALLDKTQRGSESFWNQAIPDGAPYAPAGILQGDGGAGRLELWTYNDKYDDESGTATEYLAQDQVVGTGGAIQGVRCFGAIRDTRAQLQALAMFPKMYDKEDPSVTYALTQSAPLMVPAQPNGSFRLKVNG